MGHKIASLSDDITINELLTEIAKQEDIGATTGVRYEGLTHILYRKLWDRQVDEAYQEARKKYNLDHDRAKGVQHLVYLAQTYLSRGDSIEAGVLLRSIHEISDPDLEDPLLKRAQSELERAGVTQPWIDDILKLLQVYVDRFTSQEEFVREGRIEDLTEMIVELIRGNPISPLTDDPAEWKVLWVSNGQSLWQNTRNPKAFSETEGATYFITGSSFETHLSSPSRNDQVTNEEPDPEDAWDELDDIDD